MNRAAGSAVLEGQTYQCVFKCTSAVNCGVFLFFLANIWDLQHYAIPDENGAKNKKWVKQLKLQLQIFKVCPKTVFSKLVKINIFTVNEDYFIFTFTGGTLGRIRKEGLQEAFEIPKKITTASYHQITMRQQLDIKLLFLKLLLILANTG